MFSRKSKDRPRGRTLSRDVSDELIRRIASGHYPVGSKMPTERLLSIEFGVNRHAVREALKRLEALGLVSIKHGSGIYIECVQFTAGVEIFETLLLDKDGNINTAFLRGALEFRRDMVLVITRLAVTRRKARELGKICRLIDDIAFTVNKHGEVIEDQVVIDLFDVITAACHNEVYTLISNTLSQFFKKLRVTFPVPLLGQGDVVAPLMKLRDAFEFADVVAAEEVVSQYLAIIESAATPLLDGEVAGDAALTHA